MAGESSLRRADRASQLLDGVPCATRGASVKILENVARTDASAVSVKAKTNEGLDAIGRGEAVAAHAIAMLKGVNR